MFNWGPEPESWIYDIWMANAPVQDVAPPISPVLSVASDAIFQGHSAGSQGMGRDVGGIVVDSAFVLNGHVITR